MFLLEYYRTHPELDDRWKKPTMKRIALDLDGVLANFNDDWCKLYNLPSPVKFYNFDPLMRMRFEEMKKEGVLESFFSLLKPLVKPEDLGFVPVLYVTSRPIPSDICSNWLRENGFPQSPVIVTDTRDKWKVLKEMEVDIMIDDNFMVYDTCNKNGVTCLLMDSTYNQENEVGYKRIKDFRDFKNRFL
jgi:5'(3')-deoxyribonucleotidase